MRPGQAAIPWGVRVDHCDFVTGVWCDRCALPSAVATVVILQSARTGRIVGIQLHQVCRDCGAEAVL